MSKRLTYVSVVVLLSGMITQAHATLVTPGDTPGGAITFENWTRGAESTTYQQWRGPANGGTPSLFDGGENFTSLYGTNQPDNDYSNPNGIATAQYLDATRNSTAVTSGILIGGTKNSYSFFASADWELLVPDYNAGSNATTTVILQLQVDGHEILIGPDTPNNPSAPNTVKVDGYDWVDHVEWDRSGGTAGPGFETYAVTHWFRFELPTNNASHLIEFDTYDPSLGTFDSMLYGHTSVIGIVVDTISRSVSLPGDLDHDGFVGLDDLDIVLGNWNLTVPPADPAADPTGDDFVGLDDLDIVLGNWNAGTPPVGLAVPEPGGLLTAGLIGWGLLLPRRA